MPWPGGRFTLENLLRFVDNTDAAILFWTADDKTWYRETQRFEPRDNLLFEAGLFIAAHGRDRTQLGSISGEWDLNSEVLTDHGVWTGTLAATTQ
jgi:predicted nucleotide-binding protein